jgi:hypothetical protein
MASGPVGALVGGGCFLLAALVYAVRGRAGPWLGTAGAAVLTGALAGRGLRAGHWPLTDEYEFALAFALGTALAALALGHRERYSEPGRGDSAVRATTMALAAVLVACARGRGCVGLWRAGDGWSCSYCLAGPRVRPR